MNYFSVTQLKKLKAFFEALYQAKNNLAKIPPTVKTKEIVVSTSECLQLLHEFPQFQGQTDEYIAKFLADPKKVDLLLNEIDKNQRIEIGLEKPVTVPIEEGGPVTPASAPARDASSGMPFGIPNASIPSSAGSYPRIIHNIPHTPEEPKSELVTTNKSGYVTEQPTVGTASSKLVNPQGEIIGTQSAKPQAQSKLVLPGQEPTKEIHLADKHNRIIGTHTIPSKSRLNFSFLKIKVGGGITKTVGGALDSLSPSLGRMGNRLVSGLTRMAMPGIGGRGGMGSRSFLGRLSGTGRSGGSTNTGSLVAKAKTRGGLVFAVSLIGFMFLVGGLAAVAPNPEPGSAAPWPDTGSPAQTATDISSCKFTQAGVSKPVNSSTLVALLQEAAAKTGVPASVLASLAMHESPGFVRDANNNHDAFGSSNITTQTGCVHFGQVETGSSATGALGLMQVQPPKKIHDIVASTEKVPPFEQVGAYSATGVEKGASFIGKTVDSLTLEDFCNVRTSIYLGAGVLISKNKAKPPTTSDEIKTAVCGYYGVCKYGSYDYGLEAKQDFENCQPATSTPVPPGPIGFSLSCPISKNFTITCGTEAHPINNCGHGNGSYQEGKPCDSTYYVCNGTRYSDALYKAIDVTGSNLVALPFINGKEVEWIRVEDQPIAIGGGSWGYKINYQTNYQGKTLNLDLTHINERISVKKKLKSGEPVGWVFAGIGHLHTGLSVDGNWVEPVQETKMCSK